VKVLAKLKTSTGRLWTYVHDDRSFVGKDPPAAFFEYSHNRAREHPQRHLVDYSGIMQADPYQGYNGVYKPTRRPAPIAEAACGAHWRRYFFDLAKESKAPIAIEAVRRMDELFEIERAISGKSPQERVAVRRERAKPLVDSLETWL
jgi:transposase